MFNEFHSPSLENRSYSMWFWNTQFKNIAKSGIYEQMEGFQSHDGYRRLMILPWWLEGYLTNECMGFYGEALKKATELDMKMIIWDENGFPTGYAGGHLETQYPNHTAKRLDMIAEDVVGPIIYKKLIPHGTLMGVVAMDNESKDRLDITDYVTEEKGSAYVKCKFPYGQWRVLMH